MSQAEANLRAEAAFANKELGDSRSRSKLVERALIGIVVLYAAGLLVAPLVAIVYGSLAEGAGEFFRQLTSVDALSSLKLTLIMAVSATIINTIFGVVIA